MRTVCTSIAFSLAAFSLICTSSVVFAQDAPPEPETADAPAAPEPPPADDASTPAEPTPTDDAKKSKSQGAEEADEASESAPEVTPPTPSEPTPPPPAEKVEEIEEIDLETFDLEEIDAVPSADRQELSTAQPSSTPRDSYTLPDIVVPLQQDEVARIGGSATLLEEEILEQFEFDDPNSVLLQAPGVYLRQEDGYGLRPNIGLRGASSDRSKKVTLMEDGVLFAPAAYSAPAAYYFPMMTRIVGVEVFKGPAAIQYGPNTIGGALNLQTRPTPQGSAFMVDIAGGMDTYAKLHTYGGVGNKLGGVLAEAVFLSSDGFKELDGGGDTGFYKLEGMVKGMLQSDPLGDIYHRGELKLGYSRELSNETYLGLTDADFQANPNRRYAASALDKMQNQRFQIEGRYAVAIGESFDIQLTAYHHIFWRSWDKLNRFRGGPALYDMLASPDSGQNAVYAAILRGEEDSFSDAQTLLIGDNNRLFASRGGHLQGRTRFETGPVEHDIKVGVRLHHDRIRRRHTEDAYRMEGGSLITTNEETALNTHNLGQTLALATNLVYQLRGWDLTLAPGLRAEVMRTELQNRLTDDNVTADHHVVLFGFGAHYAVLPELGIIAGIHQGFSPVSPGQTSDIKPESSMNYEAGLRLTMKQPKLAFELIGFFSHYSNLVGECTFSSGCEQEQIDQQYNAGEVHVGGLESVASYIPELGGGYTLPIRLSYTFTHTAFQTNFTSSNPQFGEVEAGDELPYVPSHQLSAQVGVDSEYWSFGANFIYIDGMREEAGTGSTGPQTDDTLMIDAILKARPTEQIEFYLKGENLTMARPVVARHPFGARPGKPLSVLGGIKLTL